MRIDQKKIKARIHYVVSEIKEWKDIRRKPPGGWANPGELALRDEATLLCSIQAHRRKKIHLQKKWKTLEEQAAFIGDNWKEYEDTSPLTEYLRPVQTEVPDCGGGTTTPPCIATTSNGSHSGSHCFLRAKKHAGGYPACIITDPAVLHTAHRTVLFLLRRGIVPRSRSLADSPRADRKYSLQLDHPAR